MVSGSLLTFACSAGEAAVHQKEQSSHNRSCKEEAKARACMQAVPLDESVHMRVLRDTRLVGADD